MVRAAYLDCFSGLSGDMLLGALLHAGAPIDALRAGLAALPVEGWSLQVQQQVRGGISGTAAHVVLADEPRPHRTLADVLSIVEAAALPVPVRDRAAAVFRALASAEARVHGTSVEEVHFHEVGAVDALVDIVGGVLALELLGVRDVHTSGLPLGSGWVRASHGRLPVPAPAVLELLRGTSVPTRATPALDQPPGELTTPTGAALAITLAQFGEPVFQAIQQVGYGFGIRELPWPNALRVVIGDVAGDPSALSRDEVVQLETHLDDATPEQLGFAMEELLSAGALDVAFSPLQMKKNRPGVLVRVLAPPALERTMADALLLHTSALGLRVQRIGRIITARAERTVQTPWGAVRVKEKHLQGRVVISPEYEDCARVARQHGLPLADVYDAARSAS